MLVSEAARLFDGLQRLDLCRLFQEDLEQNPALENLLQNVSHFSSCFLSDRWRHSLVVCYFRLMPITRPT